MGAMRIAIRCDASPVIGGGHVMRCLTLAEALMARGAEAALLVNDAAPETVPALAGASFSVVWPGPTAAAAAIGARWPGGADWAVIDHYGWSAADETALRGVADRIMALDDRPNRTHAVDLLLDPTPGRTPADWATLAPGAGVLAGPAFALIGPAWRAARADPPAGDRAGVLVALGLSDADGLADAIATAMATGGAPVHLIGPDVSPAPGVTARGRLAPEALARLLGASEIAIGAGGSSALERACLGVPSVLAVIADNQTDLAAGLAAAGAAVVCPPDPAAIAAAAKALLADAAARAAMSTRAAALVDGRGAARVAAALLGADEVLVRPAEPADARDLWLWRNDPVARAASRNSDPVAFGDHKGWFARALADPARLILIGEVGGEPVGMVRFDVSGESAEVSIALAPERRGRNLGGKLLSIGLARMQARTVTATVRADNHASQRLFAGAGFHLAGADAPWLHYRKDAAP
jgi:UDP-2,4-diacetamido-2,4,6-trideoxy-beta-L-altropyranose hydrolase